MRHLILAALLIAAPAAARDPADVLMPLDPRAKAQQAQYGYAEAVRAGDMIYLSGVVAGPAPGETNLVPAYERAFAHIEFDSEARRRQLGRCRRHDNLSHRYRCPDC